LSATEQKETVAGEASIADQNVKGKIVEFAWQLQRDGLKEESIKTYVQWLNMLLRKGANLFAPETVKEVLARQKWGNATKSLVIAAYDKFASLYEIRWKPPKCENTRKLPFIPLEQEIDDLVASCGKKTSAILRLIKETGIRIGEALRIRWIHLDLERNILVLNDPEKHGQPRMFKISNQLVAMLNRLPKATDEIFGKTQVKSAESSLRLQRNRAATKLGNPRLRQIHFHTLRHWKATMEYQKTKSIIHVMQKLGHRNINSTMIYTHIIDIETKDEYHSAVAKNIEEAGKLVETGFDYVCSHEGLMLFRRRKQKNA
jgi:integrase